jgi:hypothetical protein
VKAFFFEKKKQKTFTSCPRHGAGHVTYRAAGAGRKSLLVLSSEKNTFLSPGAPGRFRPHGSAISMQSETLTAPLFPSIRMLVDVQLFS